MTHVQPRIIVGQLTAVSGCAAVLAGRRWSLRAERMAEVGRANWVHGHTANGKVSGTYVSWAAMWQRTRCTREDSPAWRWYAARRVQVAPEWRDFGNFYRDMGPRPAGTSLDRVDGNDHYRPGNCRWATRIEQVETRRPRGSGSTPAPAPSWSKASA